MELKPKKIKSGKSPIKFPGKDPVHKSGKDPVHIIEIIDKVDISTLSHIL